MALCGDWRRAESIPISRPSEGAIVKGNDLPKPDNPDCNGRWRIRIDADQRGETLARNRIVRRENNAPTGRSAGPDVDRQTIPRRSGRIGQRSDAHPGAGGEGCRRVWAD